MISVSRGTIADLEAAVSRQIARAERALAAEGLDETRCVLRPLLADLKRLRLGLHRHTYKPTGVMPPETHPGQEAARLLAEIGFCAEHMARAIDRLSQLDTAGEMVSWFRH